MGHYSVSEGGGRRCILQHTAIWGLPAFLVSPEPWVQILLSPATRHIPVLNQRG